MTNRTALSSHGNYAAIESSAARLGTFFSSSTNLDSKAAPQFLICDMDEKWSAIDFNGEFDAIPGSIPGGNPPGAVVVNPNSTVNGVISPASEVDYYTLSVTAGQQYTVSVRGTGANPLSDSQVGVYDSAGTLILSDDDGGDGTWSLLTFTATSTGTVTIAAAPFSSAQQAPEGGTYRLDVAQNNQPDVPGSGTFATSAANAVAVGVNTTTLSFASSGDVDYFKVELVAGQYYTFGMAGGVDGATPDPFQLPAGEIDTYLRLRNSSGAIVASNDDVNFGGGDTNSAFGFLAQASGTYYLDARAPYGNDDGSAQSGGYTLTVNQVDLSSVSPLDAIDWRSSDTIDTGPGNVATVYFAAPGENFGELSRPADGGGPAPSFGWNATEKAAVMSALEEYTRILGINYEITDNPENATFRIYTTTSTAFGAYFYPQDPAYGTQMGVGAFNVDNGGWSLPGQAGLNKGGFDYGVILHEFGHAHGLAHPHDNGGGSDVLLGVTAAQNSYGVFNLNQGVYTVMSYNDAYDLGPNGPTPFTIPFVGNGWSGTLSPFDIAQLQLKYGVRPASETGDTIYALKDVNAIGTYYETIYDTGGNDTISYTGTRAAQIDLTAATLDYSPTGGGVVSIVSGIYGSYTIANGVVIENATGGSNNDVLIGNAVGNLLTGNVGNDTMQGRDGNDTLIGGLGADSHDGGTGTDLASYRNATSGVVALLDSAASNTSEAFGDSYTSIENIEGSGYADILGGTSGANQFFGGASFDFVTYQSATSGVSAYLTNQVGGVGAGQGTGAAAGDRYQSIEGLIGSGFADNLYAASGDEYVYGGGGADNIYGLAGADSLYGENGNDGIFGDTGADTMYGGAGNDTLRGDDGTDYLNGGADNDTLDGGAGADTIDGGAGNDSYTGGAGADVFVIADLGGTDTIVDFKRTQNDKIDLRSLNIDEFIGQQAFHNDAGEVRLRNVGNQWWLEGDTNGDSIADFSVSMGNFQLVQADLLINSPL